MRVLRYVLFDLKFDTPSLWSSSFYAFRYLPPDMSRSNLAVAVAWLLHGDDSSHTPHPCSTVELISCISISDGYYRNVLGKTWF